MFARPRSTAAESTSRRITETPRELSHCAIPEPMTPAPITAACEIFSAGVFEEPLRYLSARKKFRIRFWVASVAQLADGVHFHGERLFHRGTGGALDDFMSASWRRVAGALGHGRCHRGLIRLTLSFALRHPLARCIEQLLARNYFIDEPQLQCLRRAIKFAFQDHLGRRVGADESRKARRSTPGGNETKRCFRQPNLRRGIIG